MNITTGQTVYELVRSFNPTTNNPVTPATFSSTVYTNGVVNTGVTVSSILSNPSEGIYSISWSASTLGTYQVNIENTTTSVVYVSEIYSVKSESDINPSPTIYVGL
jgi:tellurite resistance protein TehA-like permease